MRMVVDPNRFVESWKIEVPLYVLVISLFLAILLLMLMVVINWYILGLLDRLRGAGRRTINLERDKPTVIVDNGDMRITATIVENDNDR